MRPAHESEFRPAPSALLFALSLLAVWAAGCSGDAASSGELAVAPVSAAVIGAACDSDEACGEPDALCLDGFPGGYCSAACGSELACPGDHVCVATAGGPRCAQACAGDEGCREGYRCAEHGTGDDVVRICDIASDIQPPQDAGVDADVGEDSGGTLLYDYASACRSSADCSADPRLAAVCLPGFPGGYCTAFCEVGSDDCGAGALCVPSTTGGICVPSCAADPLVCRPEYGCCDVGIGFGCLPPGTIDGCEAVGPLGDGELGDPCESAADCGAGAQPACYDDIEGGYCTSFGCRTDGDCGDGGVCQTGFTSLCLRGCEGADDCEDGQECCDVRDGASGCVADGFCE